MDRETGRSRDKKIERMRERMRDRWINTDN